MPAREPMSHVDTAWLRMDQPNNLMQIVGVMLFAGTLDPERLRSSIEKRLLAYDRFKQVVQQNDGGYSWVDDPEFDLDQHLHHAVLPGAAGKPELQRFVADLASTPLNPSRPLWAFHVVDTALGGQALVMRIHHCIADGIALLGVILSMADESAPPPRHSTAKNREEAADDFFWQTIWQPMSDAMLASVKVSGKLWDKYLELLTNPSRAIDYARIAAGVASEIAKLATMPLPDVKAVGKVLGCSVNDLLLSAAAGALRTYLVAHGDPVAGVEIRAMVPVNMRRPKDKDKLGNRFGLVALELPVGIENPLARLYKIRERMQALKTSYQAALTLSILGAVGMAPKFAQDKVLALLASKATAVMTNVPGATQPIYLAGAKLEQPLFWVPQSGDIGMGLSILSYDNKVQFGLITDKNMVPDPERIVAGFAPEFEKLLMLVLIEPWENLKDPAAVEAGLLGLC